MRCGSLSHLHPVLPPGLPNLLDSNCNCSLSLLSLHKPNGVYLDGWVGGGLVITKFTHIMSLCVPYHAHSVKTWRCWYLDIIERAHANLDPVTAL